MTSKVLLRHPLFFYHFCCHIFLCHYPTFTCYCRYLTFSVIIQLDWIISFSILRFVAQSVGYILHYIIISDIYMLLIISSSPIMT